MGGSARKGNRKKSNRPPAQKAAVGKKLGKRSRAPPWLTLGRRRDHQGPQHCKGPEATTEAKLGSGDGAHGRPDEYAEAFALNVSRAGYHAQRTKAVSFGFTFKCKNGVWKAEKIKLGGWAAQSGLVRKGDVIDSVDGVVCKGLDHKGFTRLMVGSEGSRASFVLRREGKEFHAVGIRMANTKPGPEDMTKATSADNPWNVIDHCEKGVQPPAHNEMADVRDSLCVEDARAEGHKRCVAVDCEMVGAGKFKNKNVLARVALVDEHGTCLLDTFVRPCKPVTDYRTQWSGIRERDLQGAPALASVRARVAKLIQGKLVVGHAVHNDLKVLKLHHPKACIRSFTLLAPSLACAQVCFLPRATTHTSRSDAPSNASQARGVQSLSAFFSPRMPCLL